MVNRSTLAIHKLDDFKAWLDEHGIEHRPTTANYQVLQVRLPNDPRWHAIFKRENAAFHLSTPAPLQDVVRAFVSGRAPVFHPPAPRQATTRFYGVESFTPMSRRDYDNLKQTAEHASDDVPWE